MLTDPEAKSQRSPESHGRGGEQTWVQDRTHTPCTSDTTGARGPEPGVKRLNGNTGFSAGPPLSQLSNGKNLKL